MTKKVTVGFKCNPKVKLKLAGEASKLGLTLSEFVENLLLNLENETQGGTMEIKNLKEQIAFYENDIIKKIFREYKGQTLSFQNPSGKDLNIKIEDPKDVFTVIINSYKIKI
ncbi:MAG: hypothetical protein WKF85_04280 [Chitinophagaceae bacterium]